MADNNGRKSGNSSAPPPAKACNHCHNSHVACDGERPCRRCVKRGVADHCRDLAPRKKGRPARTDPRFRPKYPNPTAATSSPKHPNTTISNHNTTKSQDNNGNSDDNISINNINSRTQGRSPTTLGTGDSDTETSPQGPNGLSFRPEQHHHTHYGHIDDLPYSDGDNYEDEDDDYDDDEGAGVGEERWRGQQCRDERSRAAESSDLASRMIAMMADEVHKLRKENAKLRCKVKKLRKYKRAREQDTTHTHNNHNYNRGRNDSTGAGSTGLKRPRYDHAPAARPTAPPQPQPAETWPPSVAAGECAGVREARKHMPFLNHYRMSADIPFVVGDIQSLPVFALEAPPVVGGVATWAFFNESFSSMLQFTKEELRRVPHGAVLAEDPKMLESLLPLFQDQDGRTMRGTSNMQFFYGPTGMVKYVVLVTLHWEEDIMREGERFKEKLNVATTTTAGPLSFPLSHLDPTGAYGSPYKSCDEDQATQTAGGNDNAHYWEQVLQSLAAPGVIHPAPSCHNP